jgi:hypothetical protein
LPVDLVQEALDRVVPTYHGRNGDWHGVVAAARSQEAPRRRSWSLPAVAAIAAAAALVLFWPGGGDGNRVLERALAAVDGGPVIHLVLRSGSQEFYDLEQRRTRRIPVEHELWFDRQRGLHDVERVAGRVVRDVFYPAGPPEVERQFMGLVAVYRQALRDKDASVGERSSLDGRPVYWITFDVRYPDVGIPTYDAEHRVAVDAETFVPRAWQADGFGRQAQGRDERIVRWETLPRGQGDFSAASTQDSLDDGPWFGLRVVGSRTPEEAKNVLGPTALWLGEEFNGTALGFVREVRFETGRKAQLTEEVPGLHVCYGASEFQPCPVLVTESTGPHSMAGRGHSWETIPPPGTVGLADRFGWLVREGVYVTIEASNRDQVIAAAEALRPIP